LHKRIHRDRLRHIRLRRRSKIDAGVFDRGVRDFGGGLGLFRLDFRHGHHLESGNLFLNFHDFFARAFKELAAEQKSDVEKDRGQNTYDKIATHGV